MTARQMPSPYTDNGTRIAGTGPSQVLDGDFVAVPDPAPVAAADSDDPAPAPEAPVSPAPANKPVDGGAPA